MRGRRCGLRVETAFSYANVCLRRGMKRKTLYLDADTVALLKLESMRQHRPIAEIVREAVDAYLRESFAAAVGYRGAR